MKYFAYMEPYMSSKSEPCLIVVSSDAIIEMQKEKVKEWSELYPEKFQNYSEEDMLLDWQAAHWAWEIPEGTYKALVNPYTNENSNRM